MTPAGIPRLRWRIGGLLDAGVLINYFDCISLSVAGPQLQQTLGLNLDRSRPIVQRVLLDLCHVANSGRILYSTAGG